ncbi:MAG TPA: Dabb family protein [Phaeodactylibacter sp.]|nr:Dabb family protein [Phaeodactylibacter sp.]
MQSNCIMKRLLILFLLTGLALSCSTTKDKRQQVSSAPHKNFPLVHVVYLNLKEDISKREKKQLIKAIRRLEEIPEVHHLVLGNFVSLDDPRALSDYEMVFQMSFRSSAEYATYQAHPIHLELKKLAGALLEAKPATYDYLLLP